MLLVASRCAARRARRLHVRAGERRRKVQNAKDTFYEVIRARLAAVNPGRTMVVRGVTRPGLLVEENELSLLPVVPDGRLGKPAQLFRPSILFALTPSATTGTTPPFTPDPPAKSL